ncbi:LLM class flavin-dependent oxidoreductase [Kineosporia babensis]|uniref:LLM class flavin-dependent oxidoreductase n=1 Tax=Kineosporia babensis TaxID=499548 RepID=A0A9X1SYR6_9ACTN|nr:LLM class flavin-dependent oxidoreductase [Kineosporia babensis]MCD5317184.1 LLM class flavin-dependent oxidoreductase [Kineosporia babensis]
MTYSVGVRIDRTFAPENIAPYARHLEQLGYDEAWVVEDLPFTGGISAAALALSATERMQVGVGIFASRVRTPAYLAMELATLERVYPGRVVPGIGHGVQSWMQEVGERVASPLTALQETVEIVSGLLAGEEVHVQGRYASADGVRLNRPPAVPPPVYAGVRGPKSLELAGRLCSGVLLAEPATPGFVARSKAVAQAAASAAGRADPQVAAYMWLSIDEDPRRAQASVRELLSENLADPELPRQLHDLPFAAELAERLERAHTPHDRAAALEPEWITQLGAIGTAQECAHAVEALAAAGVDRIILLPVPGREPEQVTEFAHQVLPRLQRSHSSP